MNADRPHSPPLGAGLGRMRSWFHSARIEDSPLRAAGNFNGGAFPACTARSLDPSEAPRAPPLTGSRPLRSSGEERAR